MYGGHLPDWKKLASVFIILANVFTIMLVTSEISYKYDKETRDLYHKATIAQTEYNNYLGNPNPYGYTDYSEVAGASVDNKKIAEISSAKDTAISIFWAVYAILLLAIGFAKRLRMIRIFGLIFFFITAGKVFLTIWQLGQLARIVSSLVFGVIALAASFMYAKYKDRLKEIVMSDN